VLFYVCACDLVRLCVLFVSVGLSPYVSLFYINFNLKLMHWLIDNDGDDDDDDDDDTFVH